MPCPSGQPGPERRRSCHVNCPDLAAWDLGMPMAALSARPPRVLGRVVTFEREIPSTSYTSSIKNMAHCAERDSLAAGFETAVDKYIQAARAISATTDVSEIAVLHASVQLSRQRVRDHCQQHGCNAAWINGLA
jgi:hypothetical protein